MKTSCETLYLAAVLTLAASYGFGDDERPNVLIIIVDDMNDYGFYDGFPGVHMPELDRFKESAITFRNACTAAPVCGPSRAAFFSGLYPHTTGAYLNGSDPWRQGILPETENLPELFKRSGYTVFGMGKLFHAKLADGREDAIWENDVYHGGFGPFPYPEDIIRREGEVVDPEKGGAKFWGVSEWRGPDEDFPDVRNANASIEFLQQEHEKPFLMVYGLWRPHTPLTAPKRFFDMYDPDAIPLPPGYAEDDLLDVPSYGLHLSKIWGQRWTNSGINEIDNWKRILHGYLACTSFADWSCGRVLDALDESPHADNTMVIFWSDNGYHLGEKNHYEKATLWDMSALIPAAVRLPDRSNAGAICRQPISTVDFFPTLIDYCGLQSPAHHLEGRNLRPLFENVEARWDRPAITTYGEEVFSARSERFRYIRYPDGGEELYDHNADRHELRNLSGNPEYDSVKRELKSWAPETWAPSLGGRDG